MFQPLHSFWKTRSMQKIILSMLYTQCYCYVVGATALSRLSHSPVSSLQQSSFDKLLIYWVDKTKLSVYRKILHPRFCLIISVGVQTSFLKVFWNMRIDFKHIPVFWQGSINKVHYKKMVITDQLNYFRNFILKLAWKFKALK